MKKLAQRHAALFPQPDAALLAPAVDTSIDHCTQEEIENVLPWVRICSLGFSATHQLLQAKMIGRMYPYPPLRSSLTATCVVPVVALPNAAPAAAPADNNMQMTMFRLLQEILLHVDVTASQSVLHQGYFLQFHSVYANLPPPCT